MEDLRPDTVIKNESRDLSIYLEYESIMSEREDRSKVKVLKSLMPKYRINSISTMYISLKRGKATYQKMVKEGAV